MRRVGGLADTVVDANALSLADGTATGFAFDGDTSSAFARAIDRALALIREPRLWRRMIERAMTQDFSWEAAARDYLALYDQLAAISR